MDVQALKAAVDELLPGLPGVIGFTARCPATQESVCYQEHAAVVAASVIKLTVMAEAFRQRESGIIDFNTPVTVHRKDCLPSCGALTYLHENITVTIGDLVTLMIILSDNTATNLLIDLLGMDNINQMIDLLGLKETRLRRKLFDSERSAQGIENSISAADMAHMMDLLLSGKVVSPSASDEMLRIMGDQRLNGKMPFYLHSEGIRCAHKTGEDDGITHDVGIIWSKSPIIFCFVSEKTNVPLAELALQKLAAVAAGIPI